MSTSADDAAVVAAINEGTDAGLVIRGRAQFGKAGGAVFVDWPNGRPSVVTTFLGNIVNAERVVDLINVLAGRGLPVPRHDSSSSSTTVLCSYNSGCPTDLHGN